MLLFIFLVACIQCNFVFSQNCPTGCIVIHSCPAALKIANSNDVKLQALLRSAFCGWDSQTPKVCCAKLSTSQSNTPVDQHPNLRLLPERCGLIDGERIVGGEKAGLYEFPWMTLISFQTKDGLKFGCGGSIINDRYILTAAHCISGLRLAGIRVGEHDIRTDTDCQGDTPPIICESHLQDLRVEEAIPHEEYTGKPNVRNDIGLIRTQRPINLSFNNTSPICLPITQELRSRVIGGQNATVAGWGATETGQVSSVLLKVQVPVHTEEACRNLYNRGRPANVDETKNKLCAGKLNKDSCGGDSGGPLMVEGLHRNVKRYIQYGIVSYGPRLCGSNFPGVYTDVTKYMKWILDHIKE